MEERHEIVKAIIERTAKLTGRDPAELNEDTEFAGLDMKSVNYSQLIVYLEDEVDVEISYMAFRKNATIGQAADYIMSLIG
ncbi:MAG: acyl carrier protein [Clostridiales bacterium]|nr:acyl carrier protein [Clostridiales bacterium]